jgi:L-lactate dehydrogenase (cytochrome)
MSDAKTVSEGLQLASNGLVRPSEFSELKRRFPTAEDMRRRARRVLPHFAFEYADGGAGDDDRQIRSNWASFDGIELVPRYGLIAKPPTTADIALLGQSYAAPVGIAPIGGPGTCFPGAETYMAAAAQEARIPYILGILSGITIERAAEIAPHVLWVQLYRVDEDDLRISTDLVRRCEAAGVHALVLTYDGPTRTIRPREIKSGIATPFKLTLRLRLGALSSPKWMMALMKSGIPRFVNLQPYLANGASFANQTRYLQNQAGAFTWDEVARIREQWKRPLVLKGVLHPADAAKAVSLGVDGIFVTNHGGRQVEALPTSIDTLPAIVEEVAGRATVMLDSGVRSGIDVARAVAIGADAAFAGKAFLWSLGALGEKGPRHMINLFIDGITSTIGQLGCTTVADLRRVSVRHTTRYYAEDFISSR